jgi:hypothetical protein
MTNIYFVGLEARHVPSGAWSAVARTVHTGYFKAHQHSYLIGHKTRVLYNVIIDPLETWKMKAKAM